MGTIEIVFPSILVEVTKERTTGISASTLGEALEKAAEKYGEEFKRKIFEVDGRPRRLLNFFVNNKNARLLKELQTPLSDGDRISIYPTVSGG